MNYFRHLLTLIILIIFFFLIINPNILINSVNYSSILFIKNIFPTLFPFFIISELLNNYKITYYFGKILAPIFKPIFRLNEEESMIFILSMFLGQPSNAKLLKEALEKENTCINNVNNILKYTIFPSPIFIIGTIGYTMLNNTKIGYIILIIIYMVNFILAFLNRKNNIIINKNINTKEILNFGSIINKSITNSVNVLLIILGSITLFVIINNILIYFFHTNTILFSLILEITQASNKICMLDINNYFKIILLSTTLSFGGISVHTQIKSILYEYKIEYKKVIYNRLLASFICFILSSILIIIMICFNIHL